MSCTLRVRRDFRGQLLPLQSKIASPSSVPQEQARRGRYVPQSEGPAVTSRPQNWGGTELCDVLIQAELE